METVEGVYDPESPETLHESRDLVRGFLSRVGAEELSYVGMVVVDELVSNVVRQAHSEIEVDLTWDDGTFRVEVRDGSSILPAVADLADADGGYGLRIVEAVAEDWGVRQLDGGKAVWCTLTRRSASS